MHFRHELHRSRGFGAKQSSCQLLADVSIYQGTMHIRRPNVFVCVKTTEL